MKKYQILFVFIGAVLMSGCFGEDLSDLKQKVEANSGSHPEQESQIAEAVDLGLSVLWADRNIGANYVKSSGLTYSFGFPNGTPPSDYSNINGTKYDTALNEWGEPWRMPTLAEWNELFNSCTWSYENDNGTKGFRATGPNGKSIFFPNDANSSDIDCSFWTSTISTTYYYNDKYPYHTRIYLYDNDEILKQINKSYTEYYSSYNYYIRPVQSK